MGGEPHQELAADTSPGTCTAALARGRILRSVLYQSRDMSVGDISRRRRGLGVDGVPTTWDGQIGC